MNNKHYIITASLVLYFVISSIPTFTASAAAADGLESLGNTDGILTWHLYSLEPGDSAQETVIFAYTRSRKKLLPLLESARRDFVAKSEPLPNASDTNANKVVWIKNGVTDLALEANGSFFWEGKRQALTCERGGQLSRFGYYIHYNDGADKRAGTSITQQRALENLRILEPVRKLSQTQARGLLETKDKKLQLRIRPIMGKGPTAGIEFILTNKSQTVLRDLQLSVYCNLESAHDHSNDYSILDSEIGGLLVVDSPTGFCVAMSGVRRPVSGYCGLWVSEKQFRDRVRIPIAAPYTKPTEPVTRTLSEAQATAALETDWLFQAEDKDLHTRIAEEIRWAHQLASRLKQNHKTPSLESELSQFRILQQELEKPTGNIVDRVELKKIYFEVRKIKRRIMFKNPVINFNKVLFIDNPFPQGAEWPHQARHRNGMMAVPGGRLLVLDGLHPGGQIQKLAPQKPGSFWRPDISFDGKKVLFCYKGHDEKSFHLYEINIDATDYKQLTFGDYDDLDPIYLPDGHIIFSSTRANTYIRCMPYTYCYVLARCDSDGKNIYLISRNNETDWLPTLLNDGRIIYSRWEYHDKALWRIQSLWAVNQDGTGTAAFWGNQSVWPDHLAEARPIPGSSRVMFTGLAHHDWFAGSIGILDQRKGFNFPQGLTKVTADTPWPECGKPPSDPHETDNYHASGRYTAYKSPYPLSEEDFLVSARRGGKFRLYLMDVYGNRELIYEGAHNVWYALPVRPRKRPTTQADRVAWPGTGENRRPVQPGVLFSSDIYEGVPDLPRGIAKYLRVIQMDTRTYSSWTRDARFSGPAVSLIQDDGVKRILGTVPIESDGSVHFKVPAGQTLHFQVLDEHYRALQTMRSFSGVMPGEHRGCVGCHEMHSTAPLNNRTGIALKRDPVDLTPPPWGTRSISYERLVQPVLDQHCGKCHQGNGEGRDKLDLTLRPGFKFFKEPYVTLVGGAQFSGVPPHKVGIAGAIMAENFAQSDPKSYVTFRPMQHLSFTSKLIEIAMSGEHHDVKVDPVGLRKLIGWVDTNCPYRGQEEIRAIADPQFAGIDMLPIRPRTKTAPIIARP
ncbi:MAG: HzsA-related protein [Planctomycetota bacterium]|jgi:hypothetical protein